MNGAAGALSQDTMAHIYIREESSRAREQLSSVDVSDVEGGEEICQRSLGRSKREERVRCGRRYREEVNVRAERQRTVGEYLRY